MRIKTGCVVLQSFVSRRRHQFIERFVYLGNRYDNSIYLVLHLRVMSSYWTENPNTPLLTLQPPSPSICLEYNQKDPTTLISGLLSGQVANWDTRADKDPVGISEREVCHREAVNSVNYCAKFKRKRKSHKRSCSIFPLRFNGLTQKVEPNFSLGLRMDRQSG